MSRILFDDSLPALVEVAREVLGQERLAKVLAFREPAGRLSLLYDGALPETEKRELAARLRERLGGYARADLLVADREDEIALPLFREELCQWVRFGDSDVRLIDRRIVGGDWLGRVSPKARPPRFVFASLKGGVGRTTALCLAALRLTRMGNNVLVVDLDLEAPGAGSLLLEEEQLPRLGMVDVLAEGVLSDVTGSLVDDLVASRPSLGGRLDVVPVFGRSSLERPEAFLSKLSRSMLDLGPGGTRLGLSAKIRSCLEEITARRSYDTVFIDSRAGLAELSAGPLLHLGATLLLFGSAQQQTIDGYRFLFAHLATLIEPGQESPWQNLRVVQAKAASKERQLWFREEMHALFQRYLYEELGEGDLVGFNHDVDDPDGPHFPIPIALNPVFADWSPRDTALADETFEATFGRIFQEIDRHLADRSYGS